ncbi:hypothetical protein EK904_012274 [Melospiza melodia maxima]|nr:hypothetical protein EK904_012274 [Melospiza melodia maxima]
MRGIDRDPWYVTAEEFSSLRKKRQRAVMLRKPNHLPVAAASQEQQLEARLTIQSCCVWLCTFPEH